MSLASLAAQIESKQLTLAWIGTGVMGKSMCAHLLSHGYQVNVYNRTPSKLSSLIEQGAKAFETVADCVKEADIIFTMLGFPKDVESVYLADNGIINSAKPGAVCVDMTTTKPSLAVDIAKTAEAKKISTLDAPVSGGDVGARTAKLAIMVGGNEDVFQAVHPLFQLMGSTIQYQGEAGAGQHTKMCNQIVIASTMVGVSESLLYAYQAGLNVTDMLSIISTGAAGCWTLDNLAPRVVKRDFAPGFYVEHFIKDMGIALEEAKRMELALPGLALAQQLYIALSAQGHGQKGTQALVLALEQLSGKQSV